MQGVTFTPVQHGLKHPSSDGNFQLYDGRELGKWLCPYSDAKFRCPHLLIAALGWRALRMSGRKEF